MQRCSELDDLKIRNKLEVTDIVGPDPVPEFKRRHPDGKIGKRDTDAFGLSLAVDPTGA